MEMMTRFTLIFFEYCSFELFFNHIPKPSDLNSLSIRTRWSHINVSPFTVCLVRRIPSVLRFTIEGPAIDQADVVVLQSPGRVDVSRIGKQPQVVNDFLGAKMVLGMSISLANEFVV
jgi:hypothetical protein